VSRQRVTQTKSPAQEFTLKETGSRDTVSKKDQILIVAECNPFLQEILELLEHAFRNKLERSKYLFFTLFNSFLVKKVEYIHVVTLPSWQVYEVLVPVGNALTTHVISNGLILRYSKQIWLRFGYKKNTEYYADSKNTFKNLTFCFSLRFFNFFFFKFCNGFENEKQFGVGIFKKLETLLIFINFLCRIEFLLSFEIQVA